VTGDLELWRLADGELAEAAVRAETVLRRAYAVVLEMVAEVEDRGLGAALGFGGTMGWMREVLRLSRREASQRLLQAQNLLPERVMGGQQRGPEMPETAAALRDGTIGVEHVTKLVTALREVRGRGQDGDAEAIATAEAILVPLARQSTLEAVGRARSAVLALLDADGAAPEAEREPAQPRRECRFSRTREGWLRVSGTLDPESGHLLEGLMGPLAKPRPRNSDTGDVDDRSTAQRQGDALAEIVELAAPSDELSVQGGEQAVVIVTIPLTALEQRSRRALTELPGVSAEGLRRWCCTAGLVPAVLGTRGEVLDLGRTARLATPAQRRALVLRDRGCAFPGCDRPPKWCQPHHRLPWQYGGRTDLSDLVLLCTRHHRTIHHSDWETRIAADGIPEFVAPVWLDPQRTPLRNHAHVAVAAARPRPNTARVSRAGAADRPRLPRADNRRNCTSSPGGRRGEPGQDVRAKGQWPP
jgi:hypothetical protein